MQGRESWGSWHSCQLESKWGDECVLGGWAVGGESGRMEAAATERAPEGAPDKGVGGAGIFRVSPALHQHQPCAQVCPSVDSGILVGKLQELTSFSVGP